MLVPNQYPKWLVDLLAKLSQFWQALQGNVVQPQLPIVQPQPLPWITPPVVAPRPTIGQFWRQSYDAHKDKWDLAAMFVIAALALFVITSVDQANYHRRLEAAMANPQSTADFVQLMLRNDHATGEVRVVDAGEILVEFGSPEHPLVYDLSFMRFPLENVGRPMPSVGDLASFYWAEAGNCTLRFGGEATVSPLATGLNLCFGVGPKQ